MSDLQCSNHLAGIHLRVSSGALMKHLLLGLLVAACLSACAREARVRVGKPTKYGPHARDYADVPVSVVAHARAVIGGRPEEWYVKKFYEPKGLAGESFHSLRITRIDHGVWHNYNALKFHGRWVWLGDAAGLAALSELYQPALHGLQAPVAAAHLNDLSNTLACVCGGEGRLLLSEDFRRRDMAPHTLPCWMQGRSRDPKELARHVADAVFQPTTKGYVISFCVMTPQGAVERWKIHCEREERTLIRKIEVHAVEKAGTFSYLLAG